MNPGLTEIAKEKVARFASQFGEPYRKLACYAALPLVLTPELLNYLRNHFLRGEVPWVAEADLLLSELCRPVGYEQFAFAPEVRAYLIGQMRAQIGETAMEEVARLLIRYVHHLSRTSPHLSRDGLQAEQWSAMVFLKEKREEAVAEIAEAFRDHLLPVADTTVDWTRAVPHAELARLVRITEELAAQLDEYPDLLRYASDVARLLTQPDAWVSLAKAGNKPGAVVSVAGVALPDVGEVGRNKPVFSEVEEPAQAGVSCISDGLGNETSSSTEQAPTVPTPFRDLFADEKTQGPAMVWLPGGTFLMGSPEGVGGDDEHPQHEVTLEHYAVGQYPVTVAEFSRFVEATGYRTEAVQGDGAFVRNKGNWNQTKDASWKKPYFEQTEQNPVVCISWNDAKAYCDWLSEKTGQAYGLPSEAQWEHACRAGSNARYCYGDDEAKLGDYAWYSNNASSQTHPVGEKKPNAWKLHDLHGNVWEWCADWYADDYYQQFTSKPQHPASVSEQSASGSASGRTVPPFEKGGLGGISSENPSGPASGSYRVVRGGSWRSDAGHCRSACRIRAPAIRDDGLGFRLSRTGPLPSYPFTLGAPVGRQPLADDERQPLADEDDVGMGMPTYPEFIEGLRDPLHDGTEGPAMVWLPGGEFMMGSDDSNQSDEKPAHPVRVDAISIGQYPVTFAEYDRFCSATQRKPPDDRSWGWDSRPVINVNWEDAQAYCEWLGQQTGEHYRLATEAEWEYACRAGGTTRYCYGDDEANLGDYAWYSNNALSKTHPVGEKVPNAWQLYDMHGNVLEWCADWWSSDYYQQFMSKSQHPASGSASVREQSASENPIGPASGSLRVVRGGSWLTVAGYCRSAFRSGKVPSSRNNYLGFRLARTGPWRSHPVTLGADVGRQPLADEDDVGMGMPTYPPKPRFQPYEVFHDRLPDFGETESPAMVYLPGGDFLMGDEKGNNNEKPVHAVRLNAFAMGRAPVTIGEYLKFCQATDSHWPEWLAPGSRYHIVAGSDDYYRIRGITLREPSADEKRDWTRNYSGLDPQCVDLPIVGISWVDAVAYCQWLSEATGESYALPTEAQWEYACRAGNEGQWCFGDDERQLTEYAWISGNAGGKLHPVMGKSANGFGLYDVHGNVWEWCADWYSQDYYTQLADEVGRNKVAPRPFPAMDGSPKTPANGLIPAYDVASENPSGPASGSNRVVRGGSWRSVAVYSRSAYRGSRDPAFRDGNLGFRLSRTV
ncbi:MAG: SUMF1/EgtB/PvdO family nonheme iron enzyme [Candidatus Methylumidiphilus sp.]